MSLRKKLLQGDAEIVIFGAGYIGYSTAAFYARKGVASTIIDIDPEKIKIINQGRTPYKDMQTWIGFDVSPFNSLIKATSDWDKVTCKACLRCNDNPKKKNSDANYTEGVKDE